MSAARLRRQALHKFDCLSEAGRDFMASSTKPMLNASDFRQALAEGRIAPELVLRNLHAAEAGGAAEKALHDALDQVVTMPVAKKATAAVLSVVDSAGGAS